MGAAWLMWMALIGQTASSAGPGLPRVQTATTAEPPAAPALDPLADLPLSDEELALIDALGAGPAVEPAPADPWGRPDALARRRFEGARLAETGARDVQGALRSLPALRGAWRWGAAAPLLLDGRLISAPRARAAWLRSDPGQLDAVELDADADRALSSEDLGGSIRLTRPQATYGRGGHAALGAGLRSADRALAARADLGWGGERWAVRLVASGQYEDDLRVRRETSDGSSGTATLDEDGPRADVGIEARARPSDLLEVRARGDYSLEDGTAGLYGHGGRRGLHASLDLRVGTSTLGLSLGASRLDTRFLAPDAAETGWQSVLRGHWRPMRALLVEAGGLFALDSTQEQSVDLGHRLHVAGHTFATLDVGRWFARAGLRVAHLSTHDSDAEVASATDVLPQADLQVLLVGDPDSSVSEVGEGLALRLHGARGLDVAGPWALNLARSEGAVRTWRLAAGPALRLERLWLDARFVFATRSAEDAQANLLGFELDGGARLVGGLFAAFGLGWLEGAIDSRTPAVLGVPNLRGHVALRYQLPTRNAFIEARARVASPRWPARTATRDRAEDEAFGFVRLGLAGGLDLGAGFRLEVTVDNALDRRDRDLGESTAAPGLDLRAQLGWTL